MANRNITKKEMLLAIAMSELMQTTHVHYIPPYTNYTTMLKNLSTLGFVEVLNESFYKLSVKGTNYLKKKNVAVLRDVDKAIDEFVDNL